MDEHGAGRELILLGAAATVAQVTLVREAMAALGGSELAWGALFAAWLLGVALGAAVGIRRGLPRALNAPVVAVAAAALGCLALRAAPRLTGAAAGEVLTTVSEPWLWLGAVLPSAVVVGLAFPALAQRDGDPGRAYALEASGAVVGGVVATVALAGLSTVTGLAVAAAGLLAATPGGGRRRRLGAAVLVVAAGIAAAAPYERLSWRLAELPGTLAEWRQTHQQRLWLSSGPPYSLIGDGRLLATYPDPWLSHPIAHLVMLAHPRPRRVLAVEATADGSLVALLAHPLERLWVVESDPALPGLLARWYGPAMTAALADPRVTIASTDLERALAAAAPLDLVVILGPSPATVRGNRAWTRETLAACRASLAPGGLVALRLPVGDTYLGGEAGELAGILHATLGSVFEQVTALPGERILLVASTRAGDDPFADPEVLAARWQQRAIADPVVVPELIPVLLDRSRTRDLATALASRPYRLNRSDRPAAVLPAAALAEARGDARLLLVHRFVAAHPGTLAAVAGLLLLLTVLATRPARPAGAAAAAAVVGASSMAWWLVLLTAWQARFGSVYAELGALSAAFMAGVVGGAWGQRRLGRRAPTAARLLALGAALALLVASRVPSHLSALTIPALLVAAGVVTGAAFPALAAISPERSVRERAGFVFAADELGAAAAALLVGTVALPILGATVTALGLASIQLAATVRLASGGHGAAGVIPGE